MFKMKSPKMAGAKMPKSATRHMPKLRPHMAFDAGNAMHKAFRDTGTMVSPDQAFTSAMAGPPAGGGEAPGGSALPPASLPPTG